MSALNAFLPALANLAIVQSVPAEPPPQSEILVEGPRLHSQIDDFVQKLTPAHNDQIERFVEDVCPGVIGLSPDLSNEIALRIRRVAAAVGATVAKPGCSPNLVLQIVQDKRTAITQLRDGLPGLFSEMGASDFRKLVDFPGPTAAWHLSSRVGADGMPLSAIRIRRTDGPNDAAPLVRGWALSRVKMQVVRRFDVALVIVEARALDQADTRQLADYTVMRALASTGYADADLPARSILQLFNGGTTPIQQPESVTWWDFAFLKSLYRSSNRVDASDQRGQMVQLMAAELKKVPPDQR